LIGFADGAWESIQHLYDDPARDVLAERLDAMLDVLEQDPGDARVKRHPMQAPQLWHFTVAGNGEVWSVLWEPDANGDPYIHFAGTGLV
jgi:hypothetical protein